MQDCEVYVDPEEDEVFFGCVSERERSLCNKLVNHTGASPKDECIFNKTSKVDLDENNENILNNEQASRKVLINEAANNSFEINQELNKTFTNNTSVELDHNYSTPMKHKIDKTILTTPKSIVKADKDGGFLKVLSEIALVKAEAEGDNSNEEKKEDEDKENKMIRTVPLIKVIEATPEKPKLVSPPKSVSSQLRRFRIIYNSPQNEEIVDLRKANNTLENCKNLMNKSLDEDVIDSGVSDNDKNSIDLIDFNNSIPPSEVISINERVMDKEEPVKVVEEKSNVEVITEEIKDEEPKIIAVLPPPPPPLPKEVKGAETQIKLPPRYRFSKEVRKVVEVLKKSTADDTLDLTIDEIDLESVDNSLLSAEPLPSFDVTVISKPEKVEVPTPRLPQQPKTVEKERHKLTPVLSQSKIRGIKYFSDRKGINQASSGMKCAKKLPLEEKKISAEEKPTGGRLVEKEANGVSSSRIPVFGMKSSRIPLHSSERATRPATTKTPLKTPTGKTYRNPKYKNIESPINAYIHNKTTALVLNVKPDTKKGPLTKVCRPETAGSAKKLEEKPSKIGVLAKPTRLPYVEYKSATPYEIEKRPESRLPRLAPTVQKLIGSNSPRVLKHEGRFFVNSPRKKNSEDTILADPCEVSLVVSQTAQKSTTK